MIDPLYTLPFLVLVLIAGFKRPSSRERRRTIQLALGISCGYLLFTLGNKLYVNEVFQASFREQGKEVIRFQTRPTPLNNFLWSGIAETPEGYFLGYYSLFDPAGKRIRFRFFPKKRWLLKSYRNEKKVMELIGITEGWFLVRREGDHILLYDLRFGELMDWTRGQGAFVFRYRIRKKGGETRIRRVDQPLPLEKDRLLAFLRRVLGKTSFRENPSL